MERVQKIIAQSGLCSRRKAEELIKDGKVKVNDKVILDELDEVLKQLGEAGLKVNAKKSFFGKDSLNCLGCWPAKGSGRSGEIRSTPPASTASR